jgi:hypothetical protein
MTHVSRSFMSFFTHARHRICPQGATASSTAALSTKQMGHSLRMGRIGSAISSLVLEIRLSSFNTTSLFKHRFNFENIVSWYKSLIACCSVARISYFLKRESEREKFWGEPSLFFHTPDTAASTGSDSSNDRGVSATGSRSVVTPASFIPTTRNG